MRPKIKEVNCTTGKEILREMNDEEFANYESDLMRYEAKIKAQAQAQAEAEAAKTAAEAKLAALGLTTDDLKALGL
jgi:hypothetical protein